MCSLSPPADSLLLLITRELRGELKRSSSRAELSNKYVLFVFKSLSFHWFVRVHQEEEVHRELPSCPAQVVRHPWPPSQTLTLCGTS